MSKRQRWSYKSSLFCRIVGSLYMVRLMLGKRSEQRGVMDGVIPVHSWVVECRHTDHVHAIWLYQHPVYRGPGARLRPLQVHARSERVPDTGPGRA